MTITVATPHGYKPGDVIVFSGMTPRLPEWVMRWPWQDGDRAIVEWLYNLFGWKLHTGFKATVLTVTSTSMTYR